MPCCCLPQELPRPSLAGSEAAAAQRDKALHLHEPSLQLGLTSWSVGAALALQESDNIQLEATDPKSDVAAHPEIQTRMLCPISDNNVLHLDLRAGYSAYFAHPELNRFYIGPESELNFEIYAGDFRINIHDRCSLLENNYEDPTVVGAGDYTRLENGIGIRALWDLNKALLTLGYDHVNYVSRSENSATAAAFPDAESDVLSWSAGCRLKPGLLAGLEVGSTLFRYVTSISPEVSDAFQWTIGPFADVQLSDYVTCRVGAGYSAYIPQAEDHPSTVEDEYGIYAHIDLTHELNRFVDYTLSGGKNITFALYGGTVDLSYARLRLNWRVLRKCSVATWLAYEHGTNVAFGGETFDRYGPGFSLGRWLTERMSASLEYQFYGRESNLPAHGYTTNLLMARINYEF